MSGCSRAGAAPPALQALDVPLVGEKLAAKLELDSLPSQPDDTKVFTNAVRHIKVNFSLSAHSVMNIGDGKLSTELRIMYQTLPYSTMSS